MSPHKRRLSPALHGLADGAASVISGRPLSAFDSALVDAISKSVAEQLRMLSLSARDKGGSTNASESSRLSPRRSVDAESRTSSQREALKRFAKELHKYAEQTNAKGNLPKLTPSSRSPATLHTISALLPYRREFKAAGLAVTSNDQAHKSSAGGRTTKTRRKLVDPDGQPVQMPQVDGKDEPNAESHKSSEISFITPGTIDEWRYALVDEIPTQDHGRTKKTASKGRNICFSCFPTHTEGRMSIQENVKRSIIAGPIPNVSTVSQASKYRGRLSPPSHIPMPIGSIDSAEPSPRHLCDGFQPVQPLKTHPSNTGYRQPSLTMAQSGGHLESCRGGHKYAHLDAEIHKHNPRPTTTQYLDPEVAVHPRAYSRPKKPVTSALHSAQSSQTVPRAMNSVPLPSFPFSRYHDSANAPTLRHMVGPLPERPQTETRKLVVRNPTESIIKPIAASDTEMLFPFKAMKKRVSASARRRSTKILSARHIRPSIPMRASSILQSIRSTELDNSRRVTDREVLRGLHVATSAACDEEVNGYVRDQSGVHIRQFLANLVALETYWSDTQSLEDKEQKARHRRAQMRKLKQHMRQSRGVKQVGGLEN